MENTKGSHNEFRQSVNVYASFSGNKKRHIVSENEDYIFYKDDWWPILEHENGSLYIIANDKKIDIRLYELNEHGEPFFRPDGEEWDDFAYTEEDF